MLIYFGVLAAIQFRLELIFPYSVADQDYITAKWLFDSKNYVVRYFLPGAMLVLLYTIEFKGKLTLFSSFVLSLILLTVFFAQASTGIVGIFSFVILLLMTKKYSELLSVKFMLVLTIIIFILMYKLNIQDHFSFIFEGWLQKDTTLTGRTDIWQSAISFISNHLLFGIGLIDLDAYGILSNSHCHQYWLQSLLTTGVIGTIFLLIIYLKTSNRLSCFCNTLTARVFTCTISAVLIMGIGEALTGFDMILPTLCLASAYQFD